MASSLDAELMFLNTGPPVYSTVLLCTPLYSSHTTLGAVLDFAAVDHSFGLWARHPWPQAVLTPGLFLVFLLVFMNLLRTFSMLRCAYLEPQNSNLLADRMGKLPYVAWRELFDHCRDDPLILSLIHI